MSGLFDAITSAITGKKKTKTTDTPKTKRGTKSGTIRLRKSEAIPVKIQERYGTRRELLRNLVHHELGWCTDDNLLYIKVGKAIRPIAAGGGIANLDIRGTSDEVTVTKTYDGDLTIYTISLAGEVENALVPPVPPQTGVSGMVLTANEDGTFEWKEPIVSSVEELEL